MKKNILKMKTKKAPQIITLKVDWLVLEKEEKRLEEAIEAKRKEMMSDDIKIPPINVTSDSIIDGLGYFFITIYKSDSELKKFINIEDVVSTLYDAILKDQEEIKKLVKKYKIDVEDAN